MARPTGVVKRPPRLEGVDHARYAALSKADWWEAYLDLYRATHGEACTADEAMLDAECRNQLIDTQIRSAEGES